MKDGRRYLTTLTAVMAVSLCLTGYTANADAPTVKPNPKDQLDYVWIPPGTFWMGCTPHDSDCEQIEEPRHQVTITKGFWMGRHEVPIRAYKKFAKAAKRQMPPKPSVTPFGELSGKGKIKLGSRNISNAFESGPGKKDVRPIVAVTFAEAEAYCKFAGGRLPTEAEWEYAARGGTDAVRYPWGDEISHHDANYGNAAGRDQWRYTAPVKSFDPNGFGLFDMAGNVWEWCSDWVDGNYYLNTPGEDPPGPDKGPGKTIRGGSWGFGPRYLRVSTRAMADPASRGDGVGFRCVIPEMK